MRGVNMLEDVKRLIGETVPLEHDLGDQEDLLMSGVLDSMSAVKLVARIEADLKITIPPTDMTFENFQNISAIAAYLEARSL